MSTVEDIFELAHDLWESGSADSAIGRRLDAEGKPVCYYCGRQLDERAIRSRLMPPSLGGRNDGYNLVISCQRCRKSKAVSLPLPREVVQNGWEGAWNIPDELAVDFLARLIMGLVDGSGRQHTLAITALRAVQEFVEAAQRVIQISEGMMMLPPGETDSE